MILKGYEKSVIRKSSIFLLLVIPGFILNYLLFFAAGKLLPANGFGVFYASITLVTIAYAPAFVLSMFFSRHITNKLTDEGIDSAILEFKRGFGFILKWGFYASIMFLILIPPIPILTGFGSYLLLLVLILSIYSLYLFEAVRIGVEAQKKIITAGIITLSLFFFRFVFGVAGLWYYKTAWSGVSGVMLSSILVVVVFYFYILKDHSYRLILKPEIKMAINKIPLFSISFGTVAILMYLDIIIAYFLMDYANLSIYTASAVLPKGLIVAIMPLMKVLYPIIVTDHKLSSTGNTNILKVIFITLVVVILGAGILIVFGGILTGSNIAVKSSNAYIFRLISMAVIPLCLTRFLVIFKLAQNSDKHPLLLLIPIAFFLGYVYFAKPVIVDFAWSFLIFSLLIFIYYLICCIPSLKIQILNFNKTASA